MATTINDVLSELIETLEDGRKGFAQGADKLSGSNRPQLAQQFQASAQQRAEFADQLRSAAGASAPEVDSSGTATAALHRGWMSLKDALTSDDPDAVVKAAITGEEHALSEYDDALGHDDISADMRQTLTDQRGEIEQSRTALQSSIS
jgi:uncharacterized protein (TIGR02284 family)